jgi:hypothetical protein
VVILLLAGLGTSAYGSPRQPEVRVTAPFIELRTGPGRGFPIFEVAGRGEVVRVLKSRTDWYKVRTPRDIEGWVHVAELAATEGLDGTPIEVPALGLAGFTARRWELGFQGGEFGGAALLAVYAGYSLTPNIKAQLTGGQVLGSFSDGRLVTASLQIHPFAEWRVSPYFGIGAGIIDIRPQTTVVRAEARRNELAFAALGVDCYVSRRFLLRAEYRRNLIITGRDDNEEVNEWKAGFSVFF